MPDEATGVLVAMKEKKRINDLVHRIGAASEDVLTSEDESSEQQQAITELGSLAERLRQLCLGCDDSQDVWPDFYDAAPG
jgi:hypothetical protein